MSEEILRALMELFAIIVRHHGGILRSEREYVAGFLKSQLNAESVPEYLSLFDKIAGPVLGHNVPVRFTHRSAKDSVKVLAICREINRTLNDEQRVVVVMRLYELLSAERKFTPHRMDIITTVAEVFRIDYAEVKAMELLVRADYENPVSDPLILVKNPVTDSEKQETQPPAEGQKNQLYILRVPSVNLYFFRFLSGEQFFLNGIRVMPGCVYSFPRGSSLRTQYGYSIYYSDVISTFLSDKIINKLSFNVSSLTYSFRKGETAISDLGFSVEEGKLVGIMGASGSGKSTLLKIISGMTRPDSGSVTLNGIDVHSGSQALDGVFGYVPQDDLLIEDLSVFDNLRYAALQSLGSDNQTNVKEVVEQTLLTLGLNEKRDLKVGSRLNNVISGGQRKRLNLALELIREPSVLFLDEPTSGLSSRDSEILMDLLRELTLKGKIIFVVIHQPSSEIFKMFDKVMILDNNGSLAWFGNPVDAVVYFKTLDSRVNASQGECPACGNVNPEMIFNIIETQVVDEFGKYTEKRKISPEEWGKRFRENHPFTRVPEVTSPPPVNLHRPGRLKQFLIYLSRDLKSKLSDKQYIIMTLLEAPLLGLLLSFIIRHIPDPGSDTYIFAENENIPVYIFMSLIASLFLGMTISAEEIFRDRNILRREHFLNLSRSGYLLSKISILSVISAVQTLLFVGVANMILGISGLFWHYWLALFVTSFCANMIGLNISSAFNSAITIYIVIPVLIIPMMVLSGAMFPFDKLNRSISSVGKVPVIAELMPTRWTYEALMVSQFKDNRYSTTAINRNGETIYEIRKKISIADFNVVYRIPELVRAIDSCRQISAAVDNAEGNFLKAGNGLSRGLLLLSNELPLIARHSGMPVFRYSGELKPGLFNQMVADSLRSYLLDARNIFLSLSNQAGDRLDEFVNANPVALRELERKYYNYKLEEIVTKYYEPEKILVYKNTVIQNTDPVYLDPESTSGKGFRTHFLSPSKYFMGQKYDTFPFNIMVVLTFSLILYFSLYFNLPERFIKIISGYRTTK